MSSAQTEVRSALAAYLDGITPLPEFEQSVARLLAGRRSARGVVHSALKAAVADGTLPPESLRRLGLVDTHGAADEDIPETEERPGNDRPPPRNAARNYDSFDRKEPIRPALKPRGNKAARASSEPPDTGTEWIENRRTNSEIPDCGVLLGNRYRLERVLGEGGMGVVFLATDQEVRGEVFAIKVLRPEIRANPESLRLLREEVRRTRALRHPHIVGVYSLNSDPSGVYMLMEYLEGKPLKTLLDEEFGRGMPLMRAWPMIYDIGSALAYAHDHNVIHSDIKPSNVIITSSGSCKLLDFGIARADRNRTTTRDATVIGALTPAYASCEMFEGRAPDQSDDVYALACVIYEMLTGKHPFGRINAMDARARKLQPAPIKVLTGRQNQALAKALEFDRKRRTASVEILLEGLKGMANNQRDRRAWLTSAASIAVIGAVSTGWFLEHRAAHRESVADVIPAAPQAPTATSSAAPAPAPTQTAPQSRVAAPALAKSEHGKEAARPDLGATATAPSTLKSKPAAAVVAPSVADTGAAVIKPTTVSVIPNAAPSKATAVPAVAPPVATPLSASSAPLMAQSKPTPSPSPAAQPPASGSATSPASKTIPASITAAPPTTGSAPLLAQSKPIPAPTVVEHPATGSATPAVQSKTTSASVVAASAATGSATPPPQSKTTAASIAAEPPAKGSAPPVAQSKPIPAPAVVEPPPSGSASPPAQSKTTPASVAAAPPVTGSATPPSLSQAAAASVTAEPRETDNAPLLAQSKPIPELTAEPPASGSAVAPAQSKTTTGALTAEPAATGSETPPAKSSLLTKEPVVAATSTAGAAAAHATPSSVAMTEQTPLPPATAAIRGEIDLPPYGKKLPAVIATTDSLAQMESEKNCPYPAQARAAVETGTAVLLVYVSPDGSTANAQLDTDGTSSSPVLDQAAIKCVREWGRFPPKLVGSKAVGYWARTKFRWSFGGF